MVKSDVDVENSGVSYFDNLNSATENNGNMKCENTAPIYGISNKFGSVKINSARKWSKSKHKRVLSESVHVRSYANNNKSVDQ